MQHWGPQETEETLLELTHELCHFCKDKYACGTLTNVKTQICICISYSGYNVQIFYAFNLKAGLANGKGTFHYKKKCAVCHIYCDRQKQI